MAYNDPSLGALPLDGLRIVDLSMFMSGPLVTLIAADLGADVIKVESLQRLDGWRGAGVARADGAPAWEGAPSFNWINRNKREITLNLADPRGADLLKQLVAISDVVIENYTPRVMHNFGLTYEALHEANPSLIMLSMPGFGLDGPWRDYTAFAWSTEQMCGMSHMTGYKDGPPLFTNTTGGDPLAGLMGAVALFAALEHRRRTGEGQHIDLSQLEACTLFMGDELMEACFNGRSAIRRGNENPTMFPHNVYRCSDDRWLAVACRDDADWLQLAAVLRCAAWSEPTSPLASLEGRRAAAAQIDAAISAWASQRDGYTAMRVLQENRVPSGVVLNGKDLLENPHLRDREFFITQERAWVGTKHYPGQPFRLSRQTSRDTTPAPLLGEHSREILGGLLGLDPSEIASLEGADVTGTVPIAAR